jgi:very-short-patch-repair endonuclease
MPIKKKSRFNYFTDTRRPTYKKDKRIKMPAVPRRPVRFQARSLIDFDFITPPPPPGMVIHRRGPVGRQWIGTAILEMRAIPHELLAGTLPERIIYKYLTEKMNFVDGMDFDYQSSLQGGRIDTGGIVADFMFRGLRVVINPLGPTHNEFMRIKKDEEQIDALASMGYQVYMIPEEDVYDEPTFITKMRQIFGWVHSGGGDNSQHQSMEIPTLEALLGLESAIAAM